MLRAACLKRSPFPRSTSTHMLRTTLFNNGVLKSNIPKTTSQYMLKPSIISSHRLYMRLPEPSNLMSRLFFKESGYKRQGFLPNFNGIGFGPNLTMTAKILIANIAVFVLMQIWGDPEQEMKHFAVSLNNVSHGRIYTMITSAFTHFDMLHILVNMYVFFSFASQFEMIFGPKRLLQLCILGGVCASTAYLAERAYLYVTSRSQKERAIAYFTPAVGASGVTTALFTNTAFLFPNASMLLFFIIPMQARLMLILFVGEETWRMVTNKRSTISASAHLGGCFGGYLYYLLLKRLY